jgi:hypothetical protein
MMHPLVRVLAMATVLAFVVSCADKTPLQPAATQSTSSTTATGSKTITDRTPFQQSVAKTIAERQSNGLPVPANVTYLCAANPTAQALVTQQQRPQPGDEVTIVATTVIHFDDPSQAGNVRWPALVIEGDVQGNAHGYIHNGDYSRTVREYLARQDPDIWTRYEFGFEPRTYTFVEEPTSTTRCTGATMSLASR